VVGSSILIIYDRNHVGAWMIDFAKTLPLPDSVTVTHRKPWQQGNHEEGWLTGMDNLIKVPSFFRLSVLKKVKETFIVKTPLSE
jgi:1D-myo-inositol-triphosphate 3-kinase